MMKLLLLALNLRLCTDSFFKKIGNALDVDHGEPESEAVHREKLLQSVRRSHSPGDPLRDPLQSGLLLTVGFMTDPAKKRTAKEWDVCIRSTRASMGRAMKELTGPEATATWVLRQLQGAGLDEMIQNFDMLRDPTRLIEMGFHYVIPPDVTTADHPFIAVENQHAQKVVGIVFALALRKVRRNTKHWWGYPDSLALIGHPNDAIAHQCLMRFKMDWDLFRTKVQSL